MQLSDKEWKQRLTPQQYHVLRQKGTEQPFTGQYVEHSEEGVYTCAACGNELFNSNSKFESTLPGLVGWPAFDDVKKNEAIEIKSDNSLGMQRLEVVCKKCDSHLGHYFDDPSSKTNKHYCINSVGLNFNKQSKHV